MMGHFSLGIGYKGFEIKNIYLTNPMMAAVGTHTVTFFSQSLQQPNITCHSVTLHFNIISLPHYERKII
jgi:hypothetical protein